MFGGESMFAIIYKHLLCARHGKVSVPFATGMRVQTISPLPSGSLLLWKARRLQPSQRGSDSCSRLMSHQVFLWNNWGGRRRFLRGQFPKKRRALAWKELSGQTWPTTTARRIIWNPSTWWKPSHCLGAPPLHSNSIATTYTQAASHCHFCQRSAWPSDRQQRQSFTQSTFWLSMSGNTAPANPPTFPYSSSPRKEGWTPELWLG